MRILIRSFLAGVLVSMGGVVYLMSPDKVSGSFLFSFALFAIVNLNLNLYTGKIGYLVLNLNWKYVGMLGITLVGNFLGTLCTAFLIRLTRMDIMDTVTKVTQIKLDDSYISMFVLAIFCGMLMFLGVDLFRSIESYVGKALSIIFVVMIFIVSGFEHCIADMFYFNLAGNLNFVTLAVLILGNSVGGTLLCFLCEKGKEKKDVTAA